MAQLNSIKRAFAIIDLLWQKNGATPSEIAEELGISTSTSYDYLDSLRCTGYIVNEDGIYHLSYAFLATGSRLQHRSKFYNVARSHACELSEKTKQNVDISVEESGEWVLLHSEPGSKGLELRAYPGLRTPLHTHAAGKVILAHMRTTRRENILDGDLQQVTNKTIVDPESLHVELSAIRDQNYWVDWDEQVDGMGEIAVPILENDSAIGAVAIVCSTGRLRTDEHRHSLLQELQGAAVSIRLNYRYS